MLTDTTAVILGILEGLTEFIPVSSTGHLILLGHAIDAHGPVAQTFEIFIQLGAILAVVVLYFKRFLGLLSFSQTASNNQFTGWHGISLLLVSCLPVFIIGAFVGSRIKGLLFYPVPVAMALIVGGVIMILVEKRQSKSTRIREVESIGYREALWVGLCQCFALWPGMSRSASTIIGGMLVGIDRKIAAEFSFLVAVPVMTVAVGYDLLKSISILSFSDIRVFGIGFIVSFVTAIIAIRFFMRILGRWSLKPFAVYRILLGLVVLTLLWN